MEQQSTPGPEILQIPGIKEGIEKACEENDLETVKRLLAQSTPDFGFLFDLMWALSKAIDKRYLDIVAYLYTNGAYLDPRAVAALIKAEDFKMLEMLRELGWDMNRHTGALDPSALPLAFDNPQVLRWMLDRGADPNPRCAYNCTPMSFAICSAPLSVIGVLFAAGGSVCAGQLLHHAVAERRSADRRAVVRALIHRGADIDERADHEHQWPHPHRVLTGTPLHCAALRGDPGLVAELLSWGADPFALDAHGRAAWQVAEDRDHLGLVPMLRRPRWVAWSWMVMGRIRRWVWLLRLRVFGPRDWESDCLQ
ncbi:hypothetical protein DV738_g289, partial [Chaetothyriales sp. CBS 135597]